MMYCHKKNTCLMKVSHSLYHKSYKNHSSEYFYCFVQNDIVVLLLPTLISIVVGFVVKFPGQIIDHDVFGVFLVHLCVKFASFRQKQRSNPRRVPRVKVVRSRKEAPQEVFLVDFPHLIPRHFLHQQQTRWDHVRTHVFPATKHRSLNTQKTC